MKYLDSYFSSVAIVGGISLSRKITRFLLGCKSTATKIQFGLYLEENFGGKLVPDYFSRCSTSCIFLKSLFRNNLVFFRENETSAK